MASVLAGFVLDILFKPTVDVWVSWLHPVPMMAARGLFAILFAVAFFPLLRFARWLWGLRQSLLRWAGLGVRSAMRKAGPQRPTRKRSRT